MKRYGQKLYVVAEIDNTNKYVSIIDKKRSRYNKVAYTYAVGYHATLFTESEKKSLFKEPHFKKQFKIVKIY